jgi:hypothetical protein
MSRLARIARALARNPKTSAAGLAALAGVALAAANNPQVLAEPESWVAVLTALGLLAAADGEKRRGGKKREKQQ